MIFNQAEEKRIELVKLKKIGPEFTENRHSEAIYTSRLLSALISKCASTNSSSSISFDNKNDYNHDYISAEQELDIDLKSSMIQNSSTSLKKRSNEVFLNTEIHDNANNQMNNYKAFPNEFHPAESSSDGKNFKKVKISRVTNGKNAIYESDSRNIALNFGNGDLVINGTNGTCNQKNYESKILDDTNNFSIEEMEIFRFYKN
ncbi:8105_t:CDS:2 [Rhizophagus irregularis]|nr:8105_t:CDS:2 [Rhizophagus irregularis]